MENVLSLAEVVVMHELLLERFGGMPGITEHGFGKLEGALAGPNLSMFGEDLFPDLRSKAAVLFFGLARAHSFSDGNKRVALVALLDFLGRHAHTLRASQDELFDFVTAAANHLTREEVAEWLATRIEPRP